MARETRRFPFALVRVVVAPHARCVGPFPLDSTAGRAS